MSSEPKGSSHPISILMSQYDATRVTTLSIHWQREPSNTSATPSWSHAASHQSLPSKIQTGKYCLQLTGGMSSFSTASAFCSLLHSAAFCLFTDYHVKKNWTVYSMDRSRNGKPSHLSHWWVVIMGVWLQSYNIVYFLASDQVLDNRESATEGALKTTSF